MDNKGMSFLLSILMLFSNVFALEINTEFIVATTSCYVYQDSSFSSAKIQKDEQDLILYHGQAVSYQSEENDFYYVTIDEDTSGYVYKYYLAQSDGSSVSVYPTFNATIRQECQILDYDGHTTGLVAQQGQRVFLYNGFKSNEKRTPVQIVIDGQLYNGYVETKYISPDGVSATLIVAISAISAGVIVILSLVFIKKRKKKKKKA